ncbi:SNF2 family domain-containing protein [Ophiocordyceps camponoti-floridani]|uniref:SNF2 family domain-containing protein n=1 Tax=Ophiocordyceps camponoti-floridani TaxID=2030778 RepID=A0A8H4VBX2_9HYPO|nr:SNF2 family domain-containing protein [Ophiocordyceps camponoti-floridani]
MRKNEEDFSATTLVIVPNLMIARNWLLEAKKHYMPTHSNRVAIYDVSKTQLVDEKKKKKKKKNKLLILEVYCDFHPTEEVSRQAGGKNPKTPSFRAGAEGSNGRTGFLLKQKWYRVILDEAHAIKNIFSRTKMACCALQSKNNWALSGTPLANSALGKGKHEIFESLVSLLMYRWMPEDTFFGHHILELPRSEQMEIWVPLSDAEYAISRITRTDKIIIYFNLLASLKVNAADGRHRVSLLHRLHGKDQEKQGPSPDFEQDPSKKILVHLNPPSRWPGPEPHP